MIEVIFGSDYNLRSIIADVVRSSTAKIVADIEVLQDEVSYWKHEARKRIAEWLATDSGIIIGSIGAALASAGYVWLVSSGAGAKILAGLKTFVTDALTLTGGVLDSINFRTIHAANDILAAVWPAFRDARQSLYSAIGGLSYELFDEAAIIPGMYRSYQAIVQNTYELLGGSWEETEVQFFEDASEFALTIEENFRKYVQDPEKLFDAFDELVVRHAVETQQELNEGLLTDVSTALTKAATAVESISEIEDNISDLVNALPDEFEEIKTGYEEYVGNVFDNVKTNFITPILESIEDVRDRLEDYQANSAEINTRLGAVESRRLGGLLVMFEKAGAERRIDEAFVEAAARQASMRDMPSARLQSNAARILLYDLQDYIGSATPPVYPDIEIRSGSSVIHDSDIPRRISPFIG